MICDKLCVAIFSLNIAELVVNYFLNKEISNRYVGV